MDSFAVDWNDSAEFHHDADDDSDNALRINLDSPRQKRRARIELKEEEKEVIENIGHDLDKFLDEKAAKSNLKKGQVKNILRQVLSSEDVLALVFQGDGDGDKVASQYEPKYTRAKAKELSSAKSVAAHDWISSTKKISETQILMHEELQEDSSGDEYVPGEESEDDRDPSTPGDLDTSFPEPTTPLAQEFPETSTLWSEDGVFKVPSAKKKKIEESSPNIALRTRSKLCLSDTPLEVIEEAFIPPDITTDMYDMECDDDDWKNFLKEFTRPLKEAQEDEDHDPEYNILADEEIDKVFTMDKEELRADKAVNITRKELNALIAELFECSEFNETPTAPSKVKEELPECEENMSETIVVEVMQEAPSSFQYNQLELLAQQMRQHVQLLTQTYLLTYEHPEYAEMAPKYKSYLTDIDIISEKAGNPTYYPLNLKPALQLIAKWEEKFDMHDAEVFEYKTDIHRVLYEWKSAKSAGTNYIPGFPRLFLEAVATSPVFIYPNLLPRVPLQGTGTLCKRNIFIQSENELLATALEQFVPFLKMDPYHVKGANNALKMIDLGYYINKYVMPCKTPKTISQHIRKCNQSVDSNPVKTYYTTGKTTVPLHYYIQLEHYRIVPPCMRVYEELPDRWKEFIYPETFTKDINTNNTLISYNSSFNTTKSTKVTKPPPYNKTFQKKRKLKLSPSKPPSDLSFTTVHTSTPKSTLEIPSRYLHFKFNSSIFTKLNDSDDMLPSMPSLMTPGRCSPDTTVLTPDDVKPLSPPSVKDNIDEINALMVASSTIKTSAKKRPSGAEIKRAKLHREFNANLRMLSTEDTETATDKTNRYVQAFFDKIQEQLDTEDSLKLIELLSNFEAKTQTTSDLYNAISGILNKRHPELLDEFLTFFTSVQAKKIGKLMPYMIVKKMSMFLRKLELFFKDQPSQLRKIYRTLTDLSGCDDISMVQVKNAVLPLLKGNLLLQDWFLQIFPNEKPTQNLLNGPWEKFEIGRDASVTPEDLYETITVPEIEDPYGGTNCICSCHTEGGPAFVSRQLHCIPCGTRYLQGRVFVQTGKGLRLAKLSFEDTSIDHISRLSPRIKAKRTDTTPTKQISPGKESQDETKLSSDDEPDKKQRRLNKTAKKRKPRKKIVPAEIKPVVSSSTAFDKEKESIENVVKKESSVLVEEPIEENPEWDCNTSIESIELKLSPEHEVASAESESEFCETSQDNNTDSELSGGESESNSPEISLNWTKDEDKIILETFQRVEDKETAFDQISGALEHRTMAQIKQRFEILINILKEMSLS